MCQDCGRLHEFLQVQSEEMFWLRKQITNLEGCIRSERLDKRKLVKEKKADRARMQKKGSRQPQYEENVLQ